MNMPNLLAFSAYSYHKITTSSSVPVLNFILLTSQSYKHIYIALRLNFEPHLLLLYNKGGQSVSDHAWVQSSWGPGRHNVVQLRLRCLKLHLHGTKLVKGYHFFTYLWHYQLHRSQLWYIICIFLDFETFLAR